MAIAVLVLTVFVLCTVTDLLWISCRRRGATDACRSRWQRVPGSVQRLAALARLFVN